MHSRRNDCSAVRVIIDKVRLIFANWPLFVMDRVAVIVSENINPFFIAVPRMIFSQMPSEEHAREICLCAESAGILPMEGGLSARVPYGLEGLKAANLIIVPYWPDPEKRPSSRLLNALKTAAEANKEVIGLCRGGFVLGFAGLLDGRRATTHWADVALFSRLFPKARLEPNSLYVEDRGITTSAGISAGIDCCLHVLRRLEGVRVANEVARLMVAPPFREGGQAQFMEMRLPTNTSDERINRAIKLLQRAVDAGDAADLRAAAAAAAMSERTFYRAFGRVAGMTPHQWVLSARLRRAQEMLEATTLSIEAIADACGFGSAVTFRQRFHERCGVSPSAWRRSFASGDDADEKG